MSGEPVMREDVFTGLTTGQRWCREELDGAYLASHLAVIAGWVICERLDLDHTLSYLDNWFTDCVDCGCNLQVRPFVPADQEALCICCAARRVREAEAEGAGR